MTKTTILVIDDDAGIRRSLALSLKQAGYAVLEAAGGRSGLEVAVAQIPALVICDVNMPEMDGYEVVAALRQSDRLTSIPFIFLTARGERAEMRRGMNLGADDYLTKPFTRDELLEAVKVRLRKHDAAREALTQQLILDTERMRSRFITRLTGEVGRAPMEEPAPPGAEDRVSEATVLFTDIRGFTTLSERLSVVEIAKLLNTYFQRACEPIVAAGGDVVKFTGDGIMAVFPHSDEQPPQRRALHAIQAGLALSLVAHRFRDWMHEHFPDRGLPEFAIGVGIHTGEVTLCQVGSSGERSFTAIGDTVNIASRLEGQTKELGWPVVASGTAIAAAGDAVNYGAHRVVHLRGRTKPVLVYQVLGLKGLDLPPARAKDDISQLLQQALAGNAEGAAFAAKAALRDALLALLESGPSLSSPLRIKNYAVIAKIGVPDGSALYLAERDTDGKSVAVRIRQRLAGREAAFARFIERAVTIGRISHQNVAPIFDHGFADDIAYIVTEYFPRGSLKQCFSLPLAPREALAVLRQAAAGLAEVHGLCALAEDLRPENLLVRHNGEIALAELDCLADAGAAANEAAAPHAMHYRAPERILGHVGDTRSDIYSLGVIIYEMLTGQRPYAEYSTVDLTRQIINGPVPTLPPALMNYQPLLSRMLAKQPAQRHPNAVALLDDVRTFETSG